MIDLTYRDALLRRSVMILEHDLSHFRMWGAAAKEPTELFTKNTGLC